MKNINNEKKQKKHIIHKIKEKKTYHDKVEIAGQFECCLPATLHSGLFKKDAFAC